MAEQGDTESEQAARFLHRFDTLYTRMQKIRDVSTTALLADIAEEPCLDFYKIGEMSVKDLRRCLPAGAGKTTAPHINRWLKNGIDDVNQLACEIRMLECKYLYHMRPDEWTRLMYTRAQSMLCTVKRSNSRKLQLVANYLYKTTEEEVATHCPGVVYKKSSFQRGNKQECFFRREHWMHLYLIETAGLVTAGTTFTNMPFICSANKLVTRDHKSMHIEQTPWMSDVDRHGYYTSGSIYKRVVGTNVDGSAKTQACDSGPPVWFDPYRCLVSELCRNRCDIDV